MRFVDTNVLLYATSTDAAEEPKAKTARTLLEERDLVLSVQVLQEFYVQATRTTRPDRLKPAHAAALVEAFTRFRVASLTVPIVRAAMATQERFQISYWDAAIIESARSLGCDLLLSEDLNDGQDFAGVRIQNPFVDRFP